ncbi:MAG: thioredoxin fold domain-containing protein [Campylobacterales bacterium]|nr:thioredoxin fold domain-containing protein [Campylobacterales bacterium]NQY53408.1 thioredoxin fold domain-containing protein [Campylobacteraceae bacterium]
MYKKIILCICLSLMSSLSAKEVSSKVLKEISSLEMLKSSGVKIQKVYIENDVYLLEALIEGRLQTLFLTKDKKNLITGKVYDVNKGVELTIPINVAILKGKEGFSYGEGKDEYYLFTDPECPYCKKFESYFPQLKKHVKINVLFYPLDFHKNAMDLAAFILSAKTDESKAQAMFVAEPSLKAFKNKKYKKGEKEKLVKIIKEQMALGEKLGVRGTPTLFSVNGKSVVWSSLLEKYNIK